MKNEIFDIADKENYSIAEILTILRFSQILGKDYIVNDKYFGRSLGDICIDIPDKRYWLNAYKELNKKREFDSYGDIIHSYKTSRTVNNFIA